MNDIDDKLCDVLYDIGEILIINSKQIDNIVYPKNIENPNLFTIETSYGKKFTLELKEVV